MCLEIDELDTAFFFSGLAWQAEKSIIGGIYHVIHRYSKANNKYMRNYKKNKESLYVKYWDVNTINGWKMSQKLPVNAFKLVENTSQFIKDFMENYNEDSDEDYFLEVEVQYLQNIHNLSNDLPFFA